MRPTRFFALVVSVLFVFGGTVRAMRIARSKAELSPEVRAKLAEVVCSGPFDAKARQILGFSHNQAGVLNAWVTCEPHSEYRGHQVYGEAECTGHDDSWSCPERWLSVMFAEEKYPRSVRLADVSVSEAVDIIEYLSSAAIEDFSKLWLLKRYGPNEYEAETSGNLYRIAGRKTCGEATAGTYEIVSSGVLDY